VCSCGVQEEFPAGAKAHLENSAKTNFTKLEVGCSVLQCVAVRCRVVQFVAVCCSVLQCAVVQCAVVYCSVLQSVAECILEGTAKTNLSVLQCVAVRCSILQCDAV